MGVSLLNFIQECKQLAKQALGKRRDEPPSRITETPARHPDEQAVVDEDAV